MDGDNLRSDLVKAVGITALLGALGGAAIGMFFFNKDADPPEEERPPIIVMNGSIVVGVEYVAESTQDMGEWVEETVNTRVVFQHEHRRTGPQRTRNSIFNASSCSQGGGWRHGPLRIKYKTAADVDGEFVLSIGANPAKADEARMQFEGAGAMIDPNDDSRLIIGGEGWWIYRVEAMNGGANNGCDFVKESRPIVRMEQKR